MGYTHYWYRIKEIDKPRYRMIVDDFKKLLPTFNRVGLKLAGWNGEGEPRIDYDEVRFNGLRNCGHRRFSLGIAWPSDKASGVSNESIVDGTWFVGALLRSRSCGGDCSYETFAFPRIQDTGEWRSKHRYNGKTYYFNFCKTAFKPYDLAVISFLIIAKNHLHDVIIVRSDGTLQNWMDGILLCATHLGYEGKFGFDENPWIRT